MESIRILGKDIAVKYVDTFIGADQIGECDVCGGEIIVTATLKEDIKNETILHEVIHCVDEMLSIGLSEEQVNRLSVGLYAVYRENGFQLIKP